MLALGIIFGSIAAISTVLAIAILIQSGNISRAEEMCERKEKMNNLEKGKQKQ